MMMEFAWRSGHYSFPFLSTKSVMDICSDDDSFRFEDKKASHHFRFFSDHWIERHDQDIEEHGTLR